uniref:Uncharacterized protein n=1 Tax=Lynx canadensis TaxID=61383 RepID=A0A667G226_LYNCA
VSGVYPSILGLYTQHITTGLFKVQCTIGCNVTSIWVEIEEKAGTCWGIEEGIGNLCINALVLVGGHHLQHRSPPGHVFLDVNSVCVLAEQWSIIIGISDLNLDLGGST